MGWPYMEGCCNASRHQQYTRLLQDHPGNVYIRIGDSDKERKYNKFYTLLNGKSEFLFEYPWHESGSVNIPVNNEMMYMIVKRYLKEYKIVKTK
ncbi:MAG: hypothetical protein IPN14_09250 [Bacteroidetes bacterium]|nr:hypothetical protein [Bacteroidota bacterium]